MRGVRVPPRKEGVSIFLPGGGGSEVLMGSTEEH